MTNPACGRSGRATRNDGGFTVIELLVVIFVIAIGIALVIPTVQVFFDRDQISVSGAGLDRAELRVNSNWEMSGQLPAGVGVAPGSNLNLSLGLSNLTAPVETDIPIEVPPCPGDPCPVFSLAGAFDTRTALNVDAFAGDDPIDVLLQAAIDLRPQLRADAGVAGAALSPQETIEDFRLSWVGEARLLLAYNVSEPPLLALVALGLFGLAVGCRRRQAAQP